MKSIIIATCLLLGLLDLSSTLKMEAMCSSETSVATQRTTGVISQKMILFLINIEVFCIMFLIKITVFTNMTLLSLGLLP
jgi:hypothetical protein